jgi:excisionase family DNA binding protein
MDPVWIQKSAQYYAHFTEPLDPENGWRLEDVQLAFMAGAREQPIRRLLPVKEVAEILATSVATIRDLVTHGELAYVKVGRGTERKHMAFAPEEIESFIKRHTERGHRMAGPLTARYGGRKRAHELAVERATTGDNDFSAQFRARRDAAKAKKK